MWVRVETYDTAYDDQREREKTRDERKKERKENWPIDAQCCHHLDFHWIDPAAPVSDKRLSCGVVTFVE